MPITYSNSVARLDGACGVEEAEPLLEWLQAHPHGQIDLKHCAQLHSAVLQVLMAQRPRVAAYPDPHSHAAAMLAAIEPDAG